MARLPYSRVVDVSVSRQDRFPTSAGFSVLAILISATKAGVLDASNRTKLYSSMEEVDTDWDAADEPYKAAQKVFSREPRPTQIKMLWRDSAASDVSDQLDLISAVDPDWYWLTHTAELNDSAPAITDIAAWAETRTVQFGTNTSDADTENPASTAHISAMLKASNYLRSSGFYHTTAGTYLAQSALGYGATRNLDRSNYQLARRGRIDSGQAYTVKFKGTPGISPINKGSAAVQAITGFVPSLGLDAAQGHLCNTVVDIGGLTMLVEGNTFGKAFIDEVHALDWLRARIQESVLGVLANTAVVPFTNRGVAFLIDAGILPPLRRAVAARIIASDISDGGDFLEEFSIEVDRIENLPVSQRRNRIAPDIKVNFRLAGALHFVSVSLTARF